MSRHARIGIVGVAAVAVVATRGLSGERPAAPPPRLDGSELVRTYCLDCHSGATPRGGFALDTLLDAPATDRKAWEKVWKTVRHEFMPPPDADQPAADERRAVARWVERTAFRADPAKPDPGRVTIRRLNRTEYKYTVRDLFGLDRDFSEALPPDDTAFGFDNIGDAQTISPALLETYLTAAEAIVASVVVEDGPKTPRVELKPDRFRPRDADETTGRAERFAGVELKSEGKYRVELEVNVGGWQEFGGEYELTATLGGRPLVKQTISVGGNKTYDLAGEVALPPGRHDLIVTTVPTKAAADGKRHPHPVLPKVAVVGPAGALEYPPLHARVFPKPTPADAAGKRAYAKEILARVGGRAFRRPVEPAALDKLVEMALAGKTFEAGVGQAITAVLTSPRFFFRAELQPQPDDPAAVHQLDEYALASRLSYLLWLSVPDDELTALAERGELRANLRGQVSRMLADAKSKRFFEDFAGQWLRTRNVLLTAVGIADVGKADPLREPMKRETDMLFEHVARGGRDLAELLTADYTFVNEPLAAHYGIPGVTGDEFRRVPLPADGRRAGILTHGSVLLSTSNPGRTSPVKRGLFVVENLLGREVPPPPPDAGTLEDAKNKGKAAATLREQLEAHRAKKACAACHAHFDPIGLALEQFGPLGEWRTKDGREPIDPRTELISGEAIAGAGDLAKALATRKDVFYRCVTEKLLTYALGRGLTPADAVAVDGIADRVAAGGGRFAVLLAGVTESAAFQTRRGDAGEVPTLAKPLPEKRRPPTFDPAVRGRNRNKEKKDK